MLKKIGSNARYEMEKLLDTNPGLESVTATMNLVAMLDGSMNESDDYKDIGYDEDDWSDSFHF